MTYVFSCTDRDTQKHLQPQYNKDLENLFFSDKEMIDHFISIYKDSYKV
jgi:hypothetical protein